MQATRIKSATSADQPSGVQSSSSPSPIDPTAEYSASNMSRPMSSRPNQPKKRPNASPDHCATKRTKSALRSMIQDIADSGEDNNFFGSMDDFPTSLPSHPSQETNPTNPVERFIESEGLASIDQVVNALIRSHSKDWSNDPSEILTNFFDGITERGEVRVLHFKIFLKLFGPEQESIVNILLVCNLPCFHGFIQGDAAEQLLTSNDSFLIRFSDLDDMSKGYFDLVVKIASKIDHHVVRFDMEKQEFVCTGAYTERFFPLQKLYEDDAMRGMVEVLRLAKDPMSGKVQRSRTVYSSGLI